MSTTDSPHNFPFLSYSRRKENKKEGKEKKEKAGYMRSITRIASKHGKIWQRDNSLQMITFISEFRLLTSNHKSHIANTKWNKIPTSYSSDSVSRTGKGSPLAITPQFIEGQWLVREDLWLSHSNVSKPMLILFFFFLGQQRFRSVKYLRDSTI